MGYFTITTAKTKAEWINQANKAARVMFVKRYKNMNEFADKDKENCTKLIQAWDALGMPVEEQLVKRCGIKRCISEEKLEDVM